MSTPVAVRARAAPASSASLHVRAKPGKGPQVRTDARRSVAAKTSRSALTARGRARTRTAQGRVLGVRWRGTQGAPRADGGLSPSRGAGVQMRMCARGAAWGALIASRRRRQRVGGGKSAWGGGRGTPQALAAGMPAGTRFGRCSRPWYSSVHEGMDPLMQTRTAAAAHGPTRGASTAGTWGTPVPEKRASRLRHPAAQAASS